MNPVIQKIVNLMTFHNISIAEVEKALKPNDPVIDQPPVEPPVEPKTTKSKTK